MIVVALQEIVRLNPSQVRLVICEYELDYKILGADPEKRILWEGLLGKIINQNSPKSTFSLLESNQLVGTSLSIFIRNNLIEHARDIQVKCIKTGMGGISGNKGSVSLSLRLRGKSLCFISSHFTAGDMNGLERDSDMRETCISLLSMPDRMYSFDYIFWMGDFNYRIDLPRDIVIDKILEKDFEYLISYDQLSRKMREDAIFRGFSEAAIRFAPTYKYDIGTNIYDSRYSKRCFQVICLVKR